MKAPNFLEWFNKFTGTSPFKTKSNATYDCDNYYDLVKIDQIANFYSQPFKPEMITEYFKGWETNERMNAFRNIDYIFFRKVDERIYMEIKGNIYKVPKTLDSFKTLLEEQCNIEIEFKDEIEEKYFK